MDNIYVLNHLINKQIGRKNGTMMVMFVYLIAAFDSMDKEIIDGSNEEEGR